MMVCYVNFTLQMECYVSELQNTYASNNSHLCQIKRKMQATSNAHVIYLFLLTK